ncbi:MAG: tetratricopeptide repeat protein [Pseudomonadota bacterium]
MYSQRDVERLLGLPRSTIRALTAAGFVSPKRGPRNAPLYSFQDLVVLRTAQALAAAGVPRHRVSRAMKELRRREESGQYALPFAGGSLSVMHKAKAPPPSGAEWFARAIALEATSPEGAMRAYERAIEADPALADARLNLGLLLHQAGQLAEAERAYREALGACGDDSLLHYNLGVLLEDMGRAREAADAYRAALRADPRFADCHYNLALLCRSLGRPKEAIRHMAAYRRLARPK